MGIFGWHYPAGAENDLRAPYNQQEPVCPLCSCDVGDCEHTDEEMEDAWADLEDARTYGIEEEWERRREFEQ